MTVSSGPGHDYHEQVGMGEAVRRGFSNYATFNGRANRGEYWWWVLATLLINAGLGIVDRAFFGVGTNLTALSSLWSLATLIPSLAVGARRLHDIDKSGWWQLIWLIPVVGWILLIVWFAQRGEDRTNRFG
jgi:uncharacterized membrane protein YhaH (DUF805 family)